MSVKRPGGTELTEHAVELAGVTPGGTILDVGCGDGTVAKMLQGDISTNCPASVLRRHPKALLYLDANAAERLLIA